MCKSLETAFISLYFASRQPNFRIKFFQVVLSNSSPVFQSFSIQSVFLNILFAKTDLFNKEKGMKQHCVYT